MHLRKVFRPSQPLRSPTLHSFGDGARSRLWHIVISSLLFLIITPIIPGVDTWCEVKPANLPPKRATFGMLYDEQAGHPLIFDGYAATGVLNDMWEFQANTWANVSPTAMPPARFLHTFTYCPPEKGGILIGGISTSYAPLGDVWRYASGTWTKVTGATIPPRHSHAVAYDSDQKMLYIFGGLGTGNNHLKDFWTYKSGKITEVGFVTGPGELYGHAMAYLNSAGELVLFGGADKNNIQRNETWIYKNDAWTLLGTTKSPTPRIDSTMVSDSLNNRIILFGGIVDNKRVNDLWSFDGTDWTQISTSLAPAKRSCHAMIYDPNTYGENASNAARNWIFHCFGGVDYDNKYLGDHWILYNRNVYFDKNIYFTINDHAILRVVDFGANHDISVPETVTVKVTSDTDPDGINLVLRETGPNTGVFINSNAGEMLGFSPTESNQDLRLIHVDMSKASERLTIIYTPPAGGGTQMSAIASWRPSYGKIRFDDQHYSAAQDDYVYNGIHDKAIITLENKNADVDPISRDNVNISVTSQTDPVGITLTLVETGNNTGVFTNGGAGEELQFSLTRSNPLKRQIQVSNIQGKGDRVTVTYQFPGAPPISNSAAWVASPKRIRFDKSSYTGIHDPAIITVLDMDGNYDTGLNDSMAVLLTSQTDPVGISLNLSETGANTGLFTSDIPNPAVAAALAESADNLLFSLIESNQDLRKLKVSNGDKVMAYYFPLGSSEITTTTLFQTAPVQVILNKPVYIGTHELSLITVNDNDANPNPNIVDTVNVTVTSDADPSGFIMTLTETDIDTGIFTIAKEKNLLSFRPMGSNSALSQLKVNDGGQIHVAYTRPHTGDLFTTDAVWGRGPIYARFDKKYYYGVSTGARLTVEDEDMNLNPVLADSFTVRLSSTTDTLGFDLTVFETGPDTGIFEPKKMIADGSQILFSVLSTKPYKNAIKVADGDVLMVACNKYVRTPVYATAFWGEALWVEKRPAVYIILGPKDGEVIQDEDVTFQFTAAASFGVSIGDVPVRQLDYQTTLLGDETTWGDWMQGTRRVYRNIPTGEYTFLVRCRNFKNLITSYTARKFYIYRTPKPPLIPPQLVVTPEVTNIRLNWSMPDAWNLFGFNIYRREEGKSKVLLNSSLISTSATFYIDIPVIPHVRYEYTVRAINKEGLIKDSNAMWTAANEDYRGGCILQFSQGYINMGNNLNEITIQVTNTRPTETIYWSLYSDNPALSVYPPSGASLGEVSEFTIKLDRHTFSPGVYTLPLYIRSNAASYLPDIVNQSNTLVVAFNIPGDVEHVAHQLWEYDSCPQPEAEGAPPIENVFVDVSPLDLDCNSDPYIPFLIKAPIVNMKDDCPRYILNVNLNHPPSGFMPSDCPELGIRRAIKVSDISSNGDGNLNGQMDAGELVTMRITLNNRGSVESRSLSFVLYSDDPYVEILGNPMYVLNNVPVGRNISKTIYFHIADNLPYMPDGYTFYLYCLLVDTDGYDWLTSFPLKAYNLTPIKLIRYAIDDDNLGGSHGNANGKLDPKEYIELPVTVFNATKVTLPRMPLLLDQETPLPVAISLFGRKLIHTPGLLPPQSSTTPDEEFEFTVPNDYNGDEVHFRLRSFNVQPYLYDDFCPDPDFVVNLGYMTTDTLAAEGEPTQLPVYGIPYRYLSTQRFVVSPLTTLESDVTFDEIGGWSQSGEIKPFQPPLFAHDTGTISLKATSNTNCFGYWESPALLFYPIVTDNLYCATFTFRSDQDNPAQTPGIRMRIHDDIFQQSDDFHIFSESSGSFSVGRGARKYPHYFIPNQFAGNGLACAFDIINMNPTDAADGTVYLEEITVARRSFDYLPFPTLIREYTFDKDKEGWIFATVPSVFTPPVGDFSDNGYLYINGVDSNTFGFWCSPLDDIVLNENIRIYCAEFIVRKDHNTLQQNMPRVRFRLNSMDNQSAVSKTIDSTSEGKSSPIDTDQSYKIFLLSPTDKDGKPIQDVSLQAAVDFINMSPFDEPRAKLLIDGVNIYVYPPDIIP